VQLSGIVFAGSARAAEARATNKQPIPTAKHVRRTAHLQNGLDIPVV
jgi:hypothetical protein